jgi:uncharacterized protein DUF3187
MRLRRWIFVVFAALLLTLGAALADTESAPEGSVRPGVDAAASHDLAAGYEADRDALADAAASDARPGAALLGPLRIRDMTPFNLLRLDMLPAHAVEAGPGSWAIESNLSFSNTFVMSDNVRRYLQDRGGRAPLSAEDAAAILAMGEDAFYVDGEFGLLEVTGHYRFARRTSAYVTLSVYSFSGGFMDGTIEGFHNTFDLKNAGRDFVARRKFETVLSVDGVQEVALEAPIGTGLGDPVLGLRHAFPLAGSRWGLVLSGEAKIAYRGEQPFVSTGTNDYGLQLALQGKFRRQAVYLSASGVSTDGQVFGIPLARRVVPTVTAAWELGLTEHSSFIGQLYASQSTVRDSNLETIQADKYQASLGLRSHRGRLIYGFAFTENLKNFENTPDIGLSLSLAWAALRG